VLSTGVGKLSGVLANAFPARGSPRGSQQAFSASDEPLPEMIWRLLVGNARRL